jgi:hypothetical protein
MASEMKLTNMQYHTEVFTTWKYHVMSVTKKSISETDKKRQLSATDNLFKFIIVVMQ